MKLPPIPRLDPELDARLVDRCLSGDARAWEALVRRHERLVYSIGRSYRLSDDDMGDVFQDVFAALVKSLGRLREARTLVRWLSVTADRIARSTALRRRRELALAADDPGGLDQLVDDAPPVGAELEQMEAQALVRLAPTPAPSFNNISLFDGPAPVASPGATPAGSRVPDWRAGVTQNSPAMPTPSQGQKPQSAEGKTYDDGRIGTLRAAVAWLRENRDWVIGVSVLLLVTVGLSSRRKTQRKR